MHIRCGVYELTLDLEGRSIANLRRQLGKPLNIDPQAIALINGQPASESQVPANTDDVEFVRVAGQKGHSMPGGDAQHTVRRWRVCPNWCTLLPAI